MLDVEKLAKGIVQYRYFQTKKAIEHIGDVGISIEKLHRYFDFGIAFLNNGKEPKLPIVVKDKINYFLNTIKLQPLTPKQEEKRLYKPRKKKIKNNIARVVAKACTSKLTQKFEYAVKFNNTLKIFNTEKECEAFCQAAEFFASFENFEIVTVVIDKI